MLQVNHKSTRDLKYKKRRNHIDSQKCNLFWPSARMNKKLRCIFQKCDLTRDNIIHYITIAYYYILTL